MNQSRDIVTYYYCGDDIEREVIVTVSADGPRDVTIESDLPDMPKSDERSLRERVAELYWAAEREEYLRSPEAERNGE